MGIPQIIILTVAGANLLFVANKHGKDEGKYNFWASLFGVVINLVLLIWGGFFK